MTTASIFSKLREELTYPEGFGPLIIKAPQQRPPYLGMETLLTELSKNGLAPLLDANVAAEDRPDVEDPITAEEKYQNICHEFSGQPQILALHALVIAACRRQTPPQIAKNLFQNLWQDHAKMLLDALDTRWKISALQTFRDIGSNEAQRRCAGELIVFFSMMKLYESERLYSGTPSATPFDTQNRQQRKLPLRLIPYSIRHGDLDRTLLGRLWLASEQDPILQPLACHLLTEINRDKVNIFRRLRLMRRAIRRNAK